MERIKAFIELLFIPFLLFSSAGLADASANISIEEAGPRPTQCITYDSTQKLIKVRCDSIHLTDIYKSLNDSKVLTIEDKNKVSTDDDERPKVWILNAGVVIEKESSLIIDSSDTAWLKITATPTIQIKKKLFNATEESNYSDDTVIKNSTKAQIVNRTVEMENGIIIVSKHNGDNPNGIHVHGSLKIDSVKITSWDPDKNDVIRFEFGKRAGEEHTKSDYDTAEARGFIRVSKDATGTTNITNSEIAYLGYSCSRCAGLSYYGGEGSVVKDSNIHHLLKGFYSKNAGHIVIDGNKFHNNYLYGIDPHTGSHDLNITNNLVYNNNASGIICSKDCYSLLIAGNEVYNNAGAARGIAFSINTTNSIAKNNNVHDQPRCISFNRESNHNQVYDNTLSNCKTGIYLSGTGNNSIYNNDISSSQYGIHLMNQNNSIYNNKIYDSKNGIVFEPLTSNESGIAITNTNQPSMLTEVDHDEYLAKIAAENIIINTQNPTNLKKSASNSTKA
ncbi:hypothetical protein BH18THE1_BH18THE1_20950 [soil metagenome]